MTNAHSVSRTGFIRVMTEMCGEPQTGVIQHGGYPVADLLFWNVGNSMVLKLTYISWDIDEQYSKWKIELIPTQNNGTILTIVAAMKEMK